MEPDHGSTGKAPLGPQRSRAASFARVLQRAVFGFMAVVFLLGMVAGQATAQNVDWVLNITDSGSDPTTAGGAITYNLNVANNGFDAAPATTITLAVPAATTLESFSGGITGCTPVPRVGPGSVVCNVPPLASSAASTLAVGVRTTTQGTVTLQASVPTAGDVDTLNNAVSESTTVTAGSDVSLSIGGPASAAAGSTVSYTLQATNNGPDALSAVTLQFPLPVGLTNFVVPSGCTLVGSAYNCTVSGPIAVGASVSRVIQAQISVGSASSIGVSASANGASPADPIASNDTANMTTTVTSGSDLAIAKSRSPGGTLLVGDALTFALSPSYTGDSPTGITVSDTIPANYTLGTVTAPGWSCTVSGQTVSCTRPAGAGAGANISLGPITIAATVASAGTPTNTATITSTTPSDPDPTNNTANDGGATILAPVVDLSANKSGPTPPLLVVGNSYAFTINATNVGNTGFFGTLVMTDTLPAGLTVTGYTLSGWSCLPAAPVAGPTTITCQRVYTPGAPLAAAATTPTVTMQTTATAAGTITNSMTVSSPDGNIPDTNAPNDTATYAVTASTGPNSADIYTSKIASLASVPAGNVETFALEVVNNGPSTATSVNLTDTLANLINSGVGPTGAGYIGESIAANAATGVSCSTAAAGGNARALSCSIASLPVCTTGVDCPVVTVQVRPGGNAGSRTNTARALSSVTADPNLVNNNDTETYAVQARADVTVGKTATPSPATAGQNMTYVLTATNIGNGLSAADNVTVTDTLPPNLTFVSATPATGSCSVAPVVNSTTGPGNNTLTCNLGTIANGSQQTITLVLRPNSVTRGTSVTNNAVVTTSTTETDSGNNSASIATPVQSPSLDLIINKTDSVDPVAVTQNTVYTITASNLGPSAAENLVITDTMPAAGLSFVSHTVQAGGTCSSVPAAGSFGGTLTCSFPYVPAGQSRAVTITALGEAKGTVTNTATVTSDETVAGFDTNPGNNTDAENTTVRTRADVEVASKTASASPVNLREGFTYTVVVRNNAGAGLAEADNVLVSDNLPANMVLTGTPTLAVVSGTASTTTCTGAAGATAFTCDLGTLSSGGVVNVTVPVKVTAVSAAAQVFTNTASVATSSLDINPGNNSNSGNVAVNASSLSGTVFRDFAGDAALNGSDTGIAGITMTLAGSAVDGTPVTFTATTDGAGNYSFGFVPAGTYTVTRGTVGEAYLTNGINSAGSAGGVPSTPTTTTNVVLPAATAATGYLFPLTPNARIGIAKQLVAGPTPNADGSFNVTFRLNVTNLSLESLNAIVVDDPLAGAAPRFGSFAALAVPATDPLVRGSYTRLAAPSGSCGGLNGGFDGSSSTTAASGFALAAGASCQIDVALRVQPTVPQPPVLPSGGRYENSATVTGVGALSGQTSLTNPQLSDTSDNGATVDPNGNGQANEPGENDPTPVNPTFAPGIALIKTADTSGVSSPPVPGDVITFRFQVRNTGNVTLAGITLTDPLPRLVLTGGPIASLAPGATDAATFVGTYTLNQADVDAGSVSNRATVTGNDPFDNPVTDLSGTTFTDDITLVTPLVPQPAISLVKIATPAFSSPPAVNDTISYTFTVKNEGNVTLSGITLTDPLPGIVLSGGPIASLAPGASDTGTFTALYTLTQPDLDAGQVVNRATVSGNPPVGLPVTDLSGATAGDDLQTVVPIGQSAAISLLKTADATDFLDGNDPGDVVRYAFTVTNNSNVTLTTVTVTDPLPGLILTGGPIASLAPGASDSTTYTATYAPTPADFAAGTVNNTATASGNYGPGGTLSVSAASSASAVVVAIQALPETFPPFATDGGTTPFTVLASDRERGGPATLGNVTITVLGTSSPAVSLNPATGLITLAPGQPAGNYTVDYRICSVLNPAICDQTTETVAQLPITAIETTKTQAVTDNGDGVTGVGDTITYTITVENKSNVPLTNLTLADTLTSVTGRALALDSGPTFVSASAGSPQGDLQIGETASYTASYVLTIATVSDGGTSNTVTATALPVFGPGVIGTPSPISDVSDDGIDTDGNTTNDPTELRVSPSLAASGLTVTKTTPRGVVERGSVVPYTITVRNDNPVVSGTLNIVDSLPQGFLYVPGSATLDGAPFAVTVTGRIVTWPSIPVPPLTTVTATLNARVTTGAPSGENVNFAAVRNPTTNGLLASVASATVRILPEAVFDCGDVIGKVFDDVNRDGYQNPAGAGGSEPGIPGVRLAGVDGTIITTDAFGRFHVPCAMLPAKHGSNFILKLDTRSLPTGYRVTTENPRVVRLTPGKMTEMTFGAAITRVVRIDVSDRAFVQSADGKAALSPAFEAGIDRLLGQITAEAANLRLVYHLPEKVKKGDLAHADRRMRLIADRIAEKWRKTDAATSGQVKLTIERTLVRGGK